MAKTNSNLGKAGMVNRIERISMACDSVIKSLHDSTAANPIEPERIASLLIDIRSELNNIIREAGVNRTVDVFRLSL